MKKSLTYFLLGFVFLSLNISCQKSKNIESARTLTNEFSDYWHAGKAEISTYKLSQNRYGELRNGVATLIFVTESFLAEEQVKADNNKPGNIPVLKLNSIKKFNTGIYPYSIMQSTFSPLRTKANALKSTASIQEWCGQTYIQVNSKNNLQIESRSYFASEGDQNIKLPQIITENEIWNLIRLSGVEELPVGTFKILPALEFIRLKHIPIKPYEAIAEVKKGKLITYTLKIPELKRTLQINFQPKFPYLIENWTEQVTPYKPTTASRITTKLLPYWNMNSNSDEPIRKEFGLK